MGDETLSNDAYVKVKSSATSGGRRQATFEAEDRIAAGKGMDPMVDPKGPAHLGPVRMSLPRFEKKGDFWLLTQGLPMAEELLLDTTGSMGDNVDDAFNVLPDAYKMLIRGKNGVLSRYDVQVATAIFNDVEDRVQNGIPVLCRSQFEMGEKIAEQMTKLPPGRMGKGNGKEDPQFGLFAAAYLTNAAINNYGLKYYHWTVSDEPLVETLSYHWLKEIFGEDILSRLEENGHNFTTQNLPSTGEAVQTLQKNAHAFFLFVEGWNSAVLRQWSEMYGEDRVVILPEGTKYLHYVKACIIGLTEGVLNLQNAHEFLEQHGASSHIARQIVRSVAHIPVAAQTFCENFDKIPMAGDIFREKTDLWPIDPDELDKIKDPLDLSDQEEINWL